MGSRLEELVIRPAQLFGDVALEPTAILSAFDRVIGRFGRSAAQVPEDARRALADIGVDWLLVGASWEDLARIAVLTRVASKAPPERLPDLLSECFRRGDAGARRAILRTLALMPEPARLVDIAALGCRSGDPAVFEAICCENPYPSRSLPDLHYFPMVLKAVFLGMSLHRVHGLSSRLSPELFAMAQSFRPFGSVAMA